jgi:tRNA threonylcarbamoyladenosine biosynthesis protein TsaB
VKFLLIDTCGEVGLVALSDGAALIMEERLPAREASRTLLDTIAKLLKENAMNLADLNAVAVVAGPGSFTGVRVGMSAAKGLCEGAGLRLITVSRLAMLANAGGSDVCAVLDAGRGEYYARMRNGTESLVTKETFLELASVMRVVVCEQKIFDALQELKPEMIEMSLRFAIPLVGDAFGETETDAALADANYVRREQDIYAKKQTQP